MTGARRRDAGGAGLSLREALALANGNGATPDTITFAPGLAGGTLFLTNGELSITTDGITIDGDINGDGTPDITISANSASTPTMPTPRLPHQRRRSEHDFRHAQRPCHPGRRGTVGTIGFGLSVGEGDRLNLSDEIVTGNHGVTGGGIAAENNAFLTLTNMTISNDSDLHGWRNPRRKRVDNHADRLDRLGQHVPGRSHPSWSRC